MVRRIAIVTMEERTVWVYAEVSSTRLDDKKDERDVQINRKGEYVAFYVLNTALVGVLAMTILEVEHFWIGNALFLAGFIAAFTSSVVKILAYRRGF
jgi:hypothetical protein